MQARSTAFFSFFEFYASNFAVSPEKCIKNDENSTKNSKKQEDCNGARLHTTNTADSAHFIRRRLLFFPNFVISQVIYWYFEI